MSQTPELAEQTPDTSDQNRVMQYAGTINPPEECNSDKEGMLDVISAENESLKTN